MHPWLARTDVRFRPIADTSALGQTVPVEQILKPTLWERVRRALDFTSIARASLRERHQDFDGALKIISRQVFRTHPGRVYGDLYRAKLLIVTKQPRWNESVAEIVQRVGKPKGVIYDGYFRWYAQYLLAIATADGSLEAIAVDELGKQRSIPFLRRTLPFFPLDEVSRS